MRELKALKSIIDESAYVSERATVIGEVILKNNVSVWPNVVLRGDVERIEVDENSNVQDGSIVHTNYDMPVIIGKNVTIGHGVILHGCIIEDNCLIGMGATILDGVKIRRNSIVAAGALVPEGKEIESDSVYMGTPAKKVRDIRPEEAKLIERRAVEYIELAGHYKS